MTSASAQGLAASPGTRAQPPLATLKRDTDRFAADFVDADFRAVVVYPLDFLPVLRRSEVGFETVARNASSFLPSMAARFFAVLRSSMIA